MSDRRLSCVIAGGGPGGMVLGYLLARSGASVTVLEEHRDFDRDFRGDSLHPYTLELFWRLGLVDELLALPHHRARFFRFNTPAGAITTADYGKLPTRFNYVALMPQARFLDFLAAELARSAAPVRTGCKVSDLCYDETGKVTGIVYRDSAGTHRLTADLVVAADGRFSKVRRAAGMEAVSLGACTDLLWFRLPKQDSDPPDADVDLFFGRNHYLALLAGPAGWQIGYSLPKGGYPAAREAGVSPIRDLLAERIPWLADRAHLLETFSQTTLLSVDIARLRRWWRPGLLLLGDAAHVISPVGGNGILMAIQDAVTAANHLAPALRGPGPVPDAVLAAVQAEREPAIRAVQAQQVRTEQRVATARETGRPITPPGLLRLVTLLPGVRRRAANANAYGPHPPVLDTGLLCRDHRA
ncbi:FAD-dependent oxidoreductase [Sciscionella marina]|uniref:FAD-dependent oxidoreductase n=1 Tax=Sciscionella marina TaxID=508770 RepID=UPI0003749925|nr:FAD-dependent oxidoreductase [Sciscionella marina]